MGIIGIASPDDGGDTRLVSILLFYTSIDHDNRDEDIDYFSQWDVMIPILDMGNDS